MGYHTLNDFRFRLNKSLGDKSQDSDELLDLWINDGYFEICAIVEFAILKECLNFETVKDQPSYEIPADTLGILSIKDVENQRILREISLQAYHNLDTEDTEDMPKYWVRRETVYELWPAPDDVYDFQLFVLKQPPVLATDADTTILPNAYDRAVHLLARRNALLDLALNDAANLTFQVAQNYLRQIGGEADWEMETRKLGVTVARSEADVRDAHTR